MSSPRDNLRDWLRGQHPPVELASAQPVHRGKGWAVYHLDWDGQPAALRHIFPVPGDNYPGRRAVDRAAAEAAGLRQFAPEGLAPDFLYEAKLPGDPTEYVVVARWVEAQTLAAGKPSPELAERYAEALLHIHESQLQQPRLSPLPRDLERWWFSIHKHYRDTEQLRVTMPGDLRDTLNWLLQSVGADAQAHKRLWAGAALAPIHGGAPGDTLVAPDGGLTLVNWQFSGLGDPIYEVAGAAWVLADPGSEAREGFVGRYLRAADDEAPGRRLVVYLRLRPFEALLDTLERAWALASSPDEFPHEDLPGLKVEALRHLFHALQTFEREPAEIEAAQQSLQLWFLKLQTTMRGPDERAADRR